MSRGAGADRRSYLSGLAILLAGGVACLAAPRVTWAEVELDTRLVTVEVAVTGRDLLPLAPAAGVLALAAIVATYAAARIGRTVIGVVLLSTGLAVSVLALRAAAGLTGRASSWVQDSPEFQGTVSDVVASPAWALITMVGGVLVALAGALTIARRSRWPAMGRRYERAGRPPGAAGDAWNALDRGEDPTDNMTGLRENDRTRQNGTEPNER
jgi:uncharacterized membrane protein (TIGR02234 family)